jgi:hypothetical protein
VSLMCTRVDRWRRLLQRPVHAFVCSLHIAVGLACIRSDSRVLLGSDEISVHHCAVSISVSSVAGPWCPSLPLDLSPSLVGPQGLSLASSAHIYLLQWISSVRPHELYV